MKMIRTGAMVAARRPGGLNDPYLAA